MVFPINASKIEDKASKLVREFFLDNKMKDMVGCALIPDFDVQRK